MNAALDIYKLLKSVVAYKASDLHLVSRSEPQIRIDGRLVALNLPVLDGRDIEEMGYSLLTEKQKKRLKRLMSLTFQSLSLMSAAFVPTTTKRWMISHAPFVLSLLLSPHSMI